MHIKTIINPSGTTTMYDNIMTLKKQGKKVVSLCIGDITFFYPKCLENITKDAVRKGYTKYTESTGICEFKDIILKKYVPNIHLYNTDNVIISNGAKQCISNCLMALLNEGDEVLIPVPYWSTYAELTKLYGAKSIFIDTEKDNFKLKARNIEKFITKNTKVLIINNPNNPTGAVIDKEELRKIVALSLKYNFYIISDEIYKDIYFKHKPESILNTSLSERARDRLIIVNGMSKSYGMSGFRIGFMIAPMAVADYVKSIQSNVTSNPNTIAQFTSMQVLKYCDCMKEYINSEIQKRRAYVLKEIIDLKEIEIKNIPEGGAYIWFKVSDNSSKFCQELLYQENIALVPGEVFGLPQYVRLSCCGEFEDIKLGIEGIKRYFKNSKKMKANYLYNNVAN